MTRFVALLHRAVERWLGRHYEGPEPPRRLAEIVRHFARLRPRAMQREWIEFAAEHARECYRTGYLRGLEWAERDLDRREPTVDPEDLVRALDPGGTWLDEPIDLSPAALDAPVEDREPDQDVDDGYADRVREYAMRRSFCSGPG